MDQTLRIRCYIYITSESLHNFLFTKKNHQQNAHATFFYQYFHKIIHPTTFFLLHSLR